MSSEAIRLFAAIGIFAGIIILYTRLTRKAFKLPWWFQVLLLFAFMAIYMLISPPP